MRKAIEAVEGGLAVLKTTHITFQFNKNPTEAGATEVILGAKHILTIM